MTGRSFESPRLDAELLLGHVLGMDRLELYLSFDRPVSDDERDRFRALLRERGRGVPVAYLLGRREFHALVFEVEPGVLVPRPETEHLVEVGLAHLSERETPVFAEAGSGSGCVVISLLVELSDARAFATDAAEAAVALTARNARKHGVEERLTVLQGDLLQPLGARPDVGPLDAVLSNPPYIAEDDPDVDPGVREHEPHEALFVPDGDPLHYVRRLVRDAKPLLRPGGLLAVEVGATSADAARALFREAGYRDVGAQRDLAGIDRVVHGRRA